MCSISVATFLKISSDISLKVSTMLPGNSEKQNMNDVRLEGRLLASNESQKLRNQFFCSFAVGHFHSSFVPAVGHLPVCFQNSLMFRGRRGEGEVGEDWQRIVLVNVVKSYGKLFVSFNTT